MQRIISTIEDAVAFLSSPDSDALSSDAVLLTGELASFNVLVTGRIYDATIPAALARGLWEFQEELYRAVAFALYGEDNIRRLTESQKQKFELVFSVRKGSSDIFAPLEEFLKNLGAGLGEGFKNMESSHKAKTLVAIALVLAVGWGGTHLVDGWQKIKEAEIEATAKTKEKEIAATAEKDREGAKTAQFELISQITKQNATVYRFDKATEEGARAIIKSASDADRIKVGRVKFDRDEIHEVTQRAVKERSEARLISDKFYVVRIEFKDSDSTRVWLANKDFEEFRAIAFSDEVTVEDVDAIIAAAKDRKPISLDLTMTYIRNQMRAAHVIGVKIEKQKILSASPDTKL